MEVEFTAETHAPTRALDLLLTGLRRALRCWPVLLIWHFASLLSALAAAVFPASALYGVADSPMITKIADGVDAWMLVDAVGLAGSMQSPQATATTLPGPLSYGLAALVWGFLLLPVLGAPVTAFLYGGALLTYRDAPARFDWGRFWHGGRRWFWGMLGLAFFQSFLFVVAFVPLAVILWLLGNLAGVGLAVALVALLLALWTVLFELARAQMVTANTQNLFAGLGRAFGLIFKRPGLVFGFYLPALLLLAVVHAVFRLGLLPVVPLGVLPLALLAQQGFIFMRLYLRAARLAAIAEI